MNRKLLHKEVQDFITANYRRDIARISLQGSPFGSISVQELATQLKGKKKAEKKLPSWFKTFGILYPPSLNLEQTSSEITAEYKASQIDGDLIADLTGGFGVDSYYFSHKFRKVFHFELDKVLSDLVQHNSTQLNVDNTEFIKGDGISYLKAHPTKFDWIFLDPARRDESGGKVFHLSDCLPNVPEHLDLLLDRSDNILLKTSPLLDITAGTSALTYVKEVHIVAVDNDVKELLWFLHKGFSGEIKIKTVNFKKNKPEIYQKDSRQKNTVPDYGSPLTFLYEPNAAIMKSGLFDELAEDFELVKLHPNTQLFSSEEKKEFPGRRFRVQKVIPYKRKKMKSIINLEKAHITTRNFPESVTTLRKELKIKEGGEHYLFFTTTGRKEKILIICKKE